MARLVLNIKNFICRIEQALPQIFGSGFPPHSGFAIAGTQHVSITGYNPSDDLTEKEFSLRNLIGDGILWAVPKHRRSVEKRLNRKFGYPEYTWKPLKLKVNLRTCNECGHDHEAGVLCPKCYAKVREETKLMQDAIQEKLGLNPIEEEVIVLYDGERHSQPAETLKGKQVVEIPKPRPTWFTKNLLQRSTQQISENKEVKPSELG